MHELSIAEALLEQVRRHAPAGNRVMEVRVEAGMQRAIDATALEWAWQAVAEGTDLADAKLMFTELPYTLTCRHCGSEWTSGDPLATCACGAEAGVIGGAELRLMSLEIETPEAATLGA